MIRLVYKLRYFVATAWRGLRASSLTSGVAVVTIAIALTLMGGFALLLINMEGLLDRFGDDLQVTAYLEEGISLGQRQQLSEVLGSVEGVGLVEYISKDEALERFTEITGAHSGLLEGLEDNPLPESFVLTLHSEQRTTEGLAIVVESIRGLPGIDDLVYGEDWVEGYARAIELVRWLGMVLGGVLAFSTVLIVANTIRLAVYSRRDEIEILSLVGASRIFVSMPFLLEGILQGAIGGLLSLSCLYGMYRIALPGIRRGLELLVGLADPVFFSDEMMVLMVLTGAGLGLFGSVVAVVGGFRS